MKYEINVEQGKTTTTKKKKKKKKNSRLLNRDPITVSLNFSSKIEHHTPIMAMFVYSSNELIRSIVINNLNENGTLHILDLILTKGTGGN